MGAHVLGRRGASLAIVVALAAVAGCANSQEGDVERVADSFYSAIGSRDGAAACDVLAPETASELEQSSGETCAEAVLSEGLSATGEPGSARVFGTMAQVRYGDDTVFLARFRSGWLVMAASCVPQAHDRYDCRIKGA